MKRPRGSGTIIKVNLKSGETAWRAIINMPGQGKVSYQSAIRKDVEAWLDNQWEIKRKILRGDPIPNNPGNTITLMESEITKPRTRAKGRAWGTGGIYPVYRDGRLVAWRVQVSIPGRGIVRKQFQSREDAEVFRGKLIRERRLAQLGEKPQPKPEDTITLGQLLKEYLEYRVRESKANTPTTIETQKAQAKFWLNQLGNIPIGEITRGMVSEVLRTIAERTSGPTANRYKALLSGALNWAVERGFLESNPVKGLRQYKENPGRTRWLTPGEAEKLLNECRDNPKLFMQVSIALCTGMRAGEIARLRWQDINFERGTITILITKTGEARTIPLDPPLRKLLEKWPRTGKLVIGPFCYQKAFESALRRAGIEDFTFHDLRHTYASWKVQAGVGLRTLAGLLGHKTLAMVMRYSHLAPEHLEEARGKGIPEFIRNLSATENTEEVKDNVD